MIERFAALIQRLDVSHMELKSIILDSAVLIEFSTDTAVDRINGLATIFATDTATVMRLIVKRPSLASMTAATVKARLSELAARLELPETSVLAAALKSPDLLTGNPDTLASNLTTLAKAFGVDRIVIAKLVMKTPPLASLKPESVCARLAENARTLDIEPADLLAAALRVPTLLSLRTDNIEPKIPLLRELMPLTGLSDDMTALLAAAPAALTYSTSRLSQRLDIAKAFPRRFTISVLLSMPQNKADKLLENNCGNSPR